MTTGAGATECRTRTALRRVRDRLPSWRARHEHSAPVSAALDSACEHSHVFVDLSECTFVDSVIACLLSAHRKQTGRMAHLELVLPSHPASIAQRIANLTRLDALLRLHETRGDALASMREE